MLFLLLFTVWQALQVRLTLNDVSLRMSTMVAQLASGNTKKARTTLEEANHSARRADAFSRGPIWWTASKLPWIGDDVTAVRVVAEVSHDLTDQTLPELLDASGAFGPKSLKPHHGKLDLAPIGHAAPALEDGAEDISGYAGRVQGLDTHGLMKPLRGPVDKLRAKLTKASSLSASAAAAARLLPPMLGGEGKRTYLLTFQNNAEIRAQGGMPGALALLTARDGRIDMVRQGKPADIGSFDPPFVKLTPEENELFTPRLATYPADVTFMPDFSRSSDILKQMWERRLPEKIDGVISMDPVAMGYLLRATGPLHLDNGTTLTTHNAVDYLLRDVYLNEPSYDVQDDIFAEAARKMFDALKTGHINTKALVQAMSKSATERRFMVWSDRSDEQKLIDTTPIAGQLPTEATSHPQVGVYFNDSAADKLSYYLDYRVDVTPKSCFDAGDQSLDVRLTMSSTVPAGVTLPEAVIGPGIPGRPAGWMRNSVYVYAPVGGRIEGATLEGEDAPYSTFTYRGRQVAALTLDLAPGQKRVVELDLQSGPHQSGSPQLVSTPAARTTGHGVMGRPAC